jgi:hypothetical protein
VNTIVFADEHYERLLNRTKVITIRNNQRYNIQIGSLVRLSCGLFESVVEITSVSLLTYKEISQRDMLDDGFKTQEEMMACINSYYPEATLESQATVYRWKSVA